VIIPVLDIYLETNQFPIRLPAQPVDATLF